MPLPAGRPGQTVGTLGAIRITGMKSAVERTWEHAPSDHRIIQDIDRWEGNVQKVIEAGGAVFDGGKRKGHRGDAARKAAQEGLMFHPDAQAVWDQRVSRWVAGGAIAVPAQIPDGAEDSQPLPDAASP